MSTLKLLLLIIVLFTFSAFAVAQILPPPRKPPAGEPVRIRQSDSLKTLLPSVTFTSVEGRFSVALPKGISEFGPSTPRELGFKASGSMYKWLLKEGAITITYYEYPDPGFSLTTDSDYQGYFAGFQQSVVDQFKAKVVSSTPIKTGNLRGLQLVLELPDGKRVIAKMLSAARRHYSLIGIPSDSPDAGSLVSKAFDSFQVISKEQMDAQLKQKVDSEMPALLPQAPVVLKERSDAQDANIKSKVKTVTQEMEYRSINWGTPGRNIASVENFDEKGNYTRRIGYSNGRPFQITVFGYLDGARVSKWKLLDYDDSPPLSALPSRETNAGDTRFTYKSAYTYINGRLNERQLILNTGEKGMRYVTNYDNKIKEELVYDAAGKLNMKSVSKLDENGNEVERTSVDVLGIMRGDEKYVIKYESFDSHGNWTKRTASKLVTEGGKEVYTEWAVNYRIIEYY